MKNPIFAIVTDIHLDQFNLEQRKGLFAQVKNLMLDLGLTKLMILGDIFESRKAIPENVLNCFGDILTELSESGVEVFAIPGNHDKLVYTKRESYLTPFEHYPGFKLFQDNDLLVINDIIVFMSPYYEQKVWLDNFNSYFNSNFNFKYERKIFLSHLAVTGSKNNNGELVENGISKDIFQIFDKTFLGHYHNTHEVSSNIIHIPSICQKNFGEDDNKGVTIIYDDLSYKIVNLIFKKFVNVDIDLSITTKSQIDKIIHNALNSDGSPYVKAKFIGTESEIKSINKDELNRLGVKVQTKIKEIEESVEYSQSNEIKEYDIVSLTEAFQEFCEQENLNFEDGVKYLK